MTRPESPPFLCRVAPFLPWPLSTAVALATTPLPPGDAPPPSKRYAVGPVLSSPSAHAALVASAAWKVVFAAVAYAHCRLEPADAALPAAVARVAALNVLVTWSVGGLWDFLHLSPWSPLHARLAPLKFSGVPTRAGQVSHDFFWATASALVATAWEWAIARGIASGALPPPAAAGAHDAWWTHAPTVAALLALPYLQIVHFWAVHRFMHRWFPRRRGGGGGGRRVAAMIPDVGAWLYTWVHSLHHRSRDPTAFSGISMHPVESALFFTTMPIAAALGAHPVVVLHCKFYNIVVAMLGHESYGDPSTGGHEHWLHHQLVDVNFGGNFVPIDWLCGTHVRDEDEFMAKFAPPADAQGTKRSD
jgi:hypothetical protein